VTGAELARDRGGIGTRRFWRRDGVRLRGDVVHCEASSCRAVTRERPAVPSQVRGEPALLPHARGGDAGGIAQRAGCEEGRMTRPRDDSDEDEIHPQYDMELQLEELYSVPVYRQPEHATIEQWRALGERLLALGERHLLEGIDAAGVFLQEKLDQRRRRRLQRRAARKRARAAKAAKTVKNSC
jgi:hypothetical protein